MAAASLLCTACAAQDDSLADATAELKVHFQTSDGATGDGAPGDGASGDGAPGDGAAGDGAATEGAASAWPRFLGPRYDGSALVTADFDFSQPPKFVWSIEVGDGYGIGSIAAGRFLQMDAGIPTATAQRLERLRCFDLDTARPLWSDSQPIEYRDLLGYEDGPRASPTIAGDQVFTLGVSGLLTCRRLSDGDRLWSVDTMAQYGVVQNFFGVGSSPLVIDDKVIVMVGGSPAEDQNHPPMRLDRVTSNGSALVAFNRANGTEVWRCGDDLASYSSPIPVSIDGTTLVLALTRSGLLAIDPEHGRVRWSFAHRASLLESVNAIVPLVRDNQIFVSECYEVGSVVLKATADSVTAVWRDPPRNRRLQSMRCHWSTPVLAGGYIYGCSGRNAPDSDFRCIDFSTGEVKWADPRRIRSAVTRLGDHLLVLEERGLLQVLKTNPQRMELVAQWDLSLPDQDRPALSYPCWSAPVVVGNKLFVRGTRYVVCLELAVAR